MMSGRRFTGLLFILIILIAGLLFIKSSYFTVGTVVVEGNKYIMTEDIYRIADIPKTINIFSLNTSTIKSRLLQDLRIGQADVSRKFPATIVISVKESTPMAYVASNYGFLELNKQGVVMATLKNIKQLNVPMLTGIRLDNEYVNDKIENPVIQHTLQYLSLLDEVTLSQLSEINLHLPEQVSAYTTHSVHIRLGNSEQLSDKAKLTNDILHEIADKKMVVEYIDLNYSSPFLKLKQ